MTTSATPPEPVKMPNPPASPQATKDEFTSAEYIDLSAKQKESMRQYADATELKKHREKLHSDLEKSKSECADLQDFKTKYHVLKERYEGAILFDIAAPIISGLGGVWAGMTGSSNWVCAVGWTLMIIAGMYVIARPIWLNFWKTKNP